MPPATLDAKDALLGIFVGAVRADGRELKTEFQTASLHLEALDDVAPVSILDLRNRTEPLGRMYEEMGADAFLAACTAALPAAARPRVFRAVAAVFTSDGDVSDAEFAYFRLLARHLDVPHQEMLSALRMHA